MPTTIIQTRHAPQAIGTYSQGVEADGAIYLSGQIPLDPRTMTLIEGPVEDQVRRVFDNLRAVAEAAGSGLENTVKLTVYLTDLGHFDSVNRVMAEYFAEHYPARAVVGVAALPRGASVEIDAIVAVPER